MQLAMGLALAAGARALWPSFREQVADALPRQVTRRYYLAAAAHGGLRIAAELLGLYVALAAGTKVLPPRLRFRRWTAWMRATLTLWWIVLISGIWVYHVWYAGSR